MRALPIATLAAYPLPSVASGGDVLSLAWLQAALLVAVLVSLVLLNLSALRKLLVFVAYLLGVFLSGAFVWNVPYMTNHFLVAAVSVGIPLLIWLGGLALVLQGGKNITSRWRATR